MGKYTKKIEPYFKNPNPKMEKFLGVLLGLTVIATFAVPAYFGLMGNLHYTSASSFTRFVGIILVKMTICIKLETDWAKAVAKAIQAERS